MSFICGKGFFNPNFHSPVSKKNETLNAEELIWDEKNGKIYSDKFVKITTADEIIYGEGFEANEDFTNYKIKNIKGTINITNPDSSDIDENN